MACDRLATLLVGWWVAAWPHYWWLRLTFLSVVHRNFNGRVGDTGVTWLGVVVDPSLDNGAAVAKAVTLWLVLSVLIVMATERSLRGRRPTAVRIGLGVGFSVAFYVFCRVFVALLPTNIPGALVAYYQLVTMLPLMKPGSELDKVQAIVLGGAAA